MIFFSALDQKTAQFNFAPSSCLVYNWMQLILFLFFFFAINGRAASPLKRKKNYR